MTEKTLIPDDAAAVSVFPLRVPVGVKVLPHGEGLPLPSYGTAGAAGVDLHAAIADTLTLEPGKRVLIPTGLSIALAPSFELQIRARSGLSIKNGIIPLNAPGTIDEDYRHEVGVILFNAGEEPFVIERGMRIAQGVLAPVYRLEWVQVEELPAADSLRSGGFGSTGL